VVICYDYNRNIKAVNPPFCLQYACLLWGGKAFALQWRVFVLSCTLQRYLAFDLPLRQVANLCDAQERTEQ
jgi:hypothetical protein